MKIALKINHQMSPKFNDFYDSSKRTFTPRYINFTSVSRHTNRHTDGMQAVAYLGLCKGESEGIMVEMPKASVWRGTAPSPENFGILFLEMLHFGAFVCTTEQNFSL